jgi:antitoxin (DNA-binding transcriptional repressor) of toxin-antitoxin stability system
MQQISGIMGGIRGILRFTRQSYKECAQVLQIPVKQAASTLDKLLKEVAKGQDVVIIGTDGSAYKLTVLPRTPEPLFGSAKGQVTIGPDFDKPVEGFEDYGL